MTHKELITFDKVFKYYLNDNDLDEEARDFYIDTMEVRTDFSILIPQSRLLKAEDSEQSSQLRFFKADVPKQISHIYFSEQILELNKNCSFV